MQIAGIMLIVVMRPSHIAQPIFVLILQCLLIHLTGSLVISLNAVLVALTFITLQIDVDTLNFAEGAKILSIQNYIIFSLLGSSYSL